MCYTVDEIGENYVVVNGGRIEVDPPFESVPDKQNYENWLNGVITDALTAVRSRAEIPNLQDYLAQMDRGWGSD